MNVEYEHTGTPIGTVLYKDGGITIRLTEEAKKDPAIMRFFGFKGYIPSSFEICGKKEDLTNAQD